MTGRILMLAIVAGLLWVAPALSEAPAETVCIQCHGGQPGRLGAPVKDWQGSVHQRNGISCHDCHGGDPTDFANAMNPERGFIGAPDYEKVPEFCGRCHVGVLADYRQSAHGRKVGEGGAQCVICHHNHAVQEARLDLINEQDCSRCHEYGRAAQIKTALAETDARFVAVGGELERLKRLGVSVEGLKGRLFDLRNRFHRVFHSVEVDKVRAETGGVQAEISAIQKQIDEYDDQFSRRKLWGGVAVGLLLLLGVVLLQVRHTYAEEERGE
jgi:nitrate/TMAO reductase-like tetraheme cytochrome c subunit